ncbi:hypothetical protein B0T20DRAFT_423284, partial [Sordaria brevicollis]
MNMAKPGLLFPSLLPSPSHGFRKPRWRLMQWWQTGSRCCPCWRATEMSLPSRFLVDKAFLNSRIWMPVRMPAIWHSPKFEPERHCITQFVLIIQSPVVLCFSIYPAIPRVLSAPFSIFREPDTQVHLIPRISHWTHRYRLKSFRKVEVLQNVKKVTLCRAKRRHTSARGKDWRNKVKSQFG